MPAPWAILVLCRAQGGVAFFNGTSWAPGSLLRTINSREEDQALCLGLRVWVLVCRGHYWLGS